MEAMMDEDTVERIFNLVREENTRMNALLERTTEEFGDSGAISMCVNISVNLIAQALLLVEEPDRFYLMTILADQAADRVKAGLVQVEADMAIRKAKGKV
jgi:hypothetical protein